MPSKSSGGERGRDAVTGRFVKFTKKPHRTRIDPYGATLVYAHHPDQWAALVRKYDVDPDPAAMGSVTLSRHSGTFEQHVLIWVDLDRHATFASVVATIAHESYHAAAGLLRELGHSVEGSDEPTAYLLEWIVGWLLDHTPTEAANA